MRNLFCKLFFSFWLTMLLGGAMSFAVVSTFHHLSMELLRDDMERKMDEGMTRLIVLSGQAAEQMYRHGGAAEYDRFINGIIAGLGIRVWLIGQDRRTLTGQPVPPEFVELAEKARHSREPMLRKSETALTVAQRVTPEQEDSPVFVGVHAFGPPPVMLPEGAPPPFGEKPPSAARPPFGERAPFGERPSFPDSPTFKSGFLPPFFGRVEIIRAAIMLILVTGVCYLLAGSLAKPIRKLQHIARQIAGGDYSARVGTCLGKTSNELTDLGRDFDIMVDRTEQLINAQKRLLRDISHELRSPLARLNVALELAKKRLNAEDDMALQKIGQESDRLNELIGQLLILNRLESGAEMQAREQVNLAELLRAVTADVDFEAVGNSRGVTLLYPAEVVVTGSRELLRRAVENVVRNGARFTARDTRVEVTLTASATEAVITVTDHGPGVPAAHLPYLFEPFYRVAAARERRSGGVGIGLAIALQAVKSHSGTVVAENGTDGQGLIVTITLPLFSIGFTIL